jgi:hypothetical protein
MTVQPKRVKAFTPLLEESLPHLASGFARRGTGASSLLFMPDSNGLILGFAMHSHMVVVEVGASDAEEGVSVLKSFAVPVKEGQRAVQGLPSRIKVGQKTNGDVNGNGHADEANEDESASSAAGGEHRSEAGDSDSDDSDSEDEDQGDGNAHRPRFVMMSISPDLQWLAGQDSSGRIGVWSLDVFKVGRRDFKRPAGLFD